MVLADTLICDVGDTINFILGQSHNAVEVDQSTFLSGGNSSNGGFSFGYGVTRSKRIILNPLIHHNDALINDSLFAEGYPK